MKWFQTRPRSKVFSLERLFLKKTGSSVNKFDSMLGGYFFFSTCACFTVDVICKTCFYIDINQDRPRGHTDFHPGRNRSPKEQGSDEGAKASNIKNWSVQLVSPAGLYTKLTCCNVAKNCHQLPKVPKSAKRCHKLPQIATSCHKLPHIARSCHKLPKVAIGC